MRYKHLLILIVILAIIPMLSLSQDNTLPACSLSDVEFLNEIIIPEFIALIATAPEYHENIDSLLVYANAQLQWRDNTLSLLPLCNLAIEVGRKMDRISSDVVTIYALDIAGVPQADNPYIERVRQALNEFQELTSSPYEITITVTTQSNMAETYYVTANGAVNIRSCASTDCGVVTTANRGDALAVVSLLNNWYELQLDNGDTGYIADFLIGINPPSTQPTAVPVQSTAIPQSNDSQSVVQPTAIPAQPTAVPVQPTAVPVSTVAVQSEAQPPSDGQICGGATTCGAMSSCEQAYACLRAGRSSLDRDKDGIPCESICGG